MDVVWIIVGIVVAVVVAVAIYYFAVHIPINVTTPAVPSIPVQDGGTSQGDGALPTMTQTQQTVPEAMSQFGMAPLPNPYQPNTLPTINSLPLVNKQIVGQSPMEDYFHPIPGSPISDNQVESLVDRRYVIRGTYPGIRENRREVIVTQPHRQTIMLCNRGGFLRRYGTTGAWECVDQVEIGDKRLGYSNTGFFVCEDTYTKHLSCLHRHPISNLHPDMQVESPFVLYLHVTN